MATGYFFGERSAPSADLYRALKSEGYSSEEIQDLPKSTDDLIDFMTTDSRMVASISLAGYRFLKEGDSESARELLSRQVANFYVVHAPEFNSDVKNTKSMTQVLEQIDVSATKYPHLRTAIESIE